MAMTHERLAVSSGLHTILTNYRVSGSPNVQNPQPTTNLLVFFWGSVLDPSRVADFVTLFFDPMHTPKNERNRYCMWRHFLYSQYFQVMVFFTLLGTITYPTYPRKIQALWSR